MNVEFRTPGQLLTSLLAEKGWTQRVLAIVLGIDETAVNKLAADKRPFTAEIALSLEEVFGTPAERFLELQKSYDLALARIAVRPDPGRNKRAHLFGGLPVSEMIKRGWLSDVKDVRDVTGVERALTKFFGVPSVDDIEILPHAAKKTQVAMETTPAQLAWLYRVKEIASEMLAPRYSATALRAALPKLKNLLSAPEEARKVPRILAESGIRYVIVEALPSAKIDGVCFWLDEAPVVGMTLRHDRIDNFWFVLRHELEHVLREHGRVAAYLDTELEGAKAGTGSDIPEEERVANEAASEFCVPHDALLEFVVRKNPFFAERDILGFAKTLSVHPGLVAGQLQHYLGKYDRFRNHLVKIKSCITPSAMVDGWGDVAPVGF